MGGGSWGSFLGASLCCGVPAAGSASPQPCVNENLLAEYLCHPTCVKREQWIGEICHKTVEMVPKRHQDFLAVFPHLDSARGPYESGLVAKATLITFVCEQYTTAYSPNEIATNLLAAGLHPDGAGAAELLDRLIRPALESFRSGGLPIDDWWATDELGLLVFSLYARCRLGEADAGAVLAELRDRWQLSELDADAAVDEARLGEPTVPELVATPETGSELAALWSVDGMATAFAHQRQQLSQRTPPNDTVAEMLDALARYRVLSEHVDQLEVTRSMLRSDLAKAREALRESMMNLSVYEHRFVVPHDEGEELLRSAVNSLRNVMIVSDIGVNAPADCYLDGLLVPDWLTEYFVGVGGRIGHRSCGPIPHWYTAFDGPEVPDDFCGTAPARVSLGVNEDPAGLAEVVRVFRARGETRHAEFVFAEDGINDVLQLALIALTGFIRLDTFRLASDGLLELVDSSRARVGGTPIGDYIRGAALKALTGEPVDTSELFRSWLSQLGENEGTNGFLGSDVAKSEELLGLWLPTAEVPEADEHDIEAYRLARARWLALHDERACQSVRFGDKGHFDAAIEAARADYRFAADNLGPQRSEQSGGTPLASLVAGLVDENHAYLHLNRDADHLDAFLCFGTEDGVVAEHLDVSATPLRAAERALYEWRDSDPDSLKRAVDVMGTALGEVLVGAIDDRGVRHLYISPVGFLHSFPFSQLPLGDGRLGDRLSMSYAPSARVLQRLRNKQSSEANRDALGVAFHEADDIPLTSAEVAIVSELYGNALALDGSQATPARFLTESRASRILHLGSHGTWRPGDGYGSGLHLAGPDWSRGYLSVARVHRQADLRNVEVAVLSACDTGRATLVWPEIQNYPGIDGAFLASGATVVISSLWEVFDVAGLMFTTTLHQRLAAGSPVLDAFAVAIDTLASGRYLELDREPEAELLDRHAPGWRAIVGDVGEMLMDPYFWAVFKLSGLVRI